MSRALLAIFFASLMAAGPAQAVLVYERPPSAQAVGRNGQIVVARNDGSRPHVVARGIDPLVSPNGREVGYFFEDRHENDSLRVVAASGGRSRMLVRSVVNPSSSTFYSPFAWSQDSRQIMVGAGDASAAWLVDVPGRTATRIRACIFFSASFSPDATSAVTNEECTAGDVLVLVRLRGDHRRRLTGDGCFGPVWGPRGIAYTTPVGGGPGIPAERDDILWLRRVGAAPQLLARNAAAVQWSADGRQLLAEAPSNGGQQPILLTPGTTAVARFPQALAAIEALSHDAKWVLGEMGGNVVATSADGAVDLLATNATLPSWNR